MSWGLGCRVLGLGCRVEDRENREQANRLKEVHHCILDLNAKISLEMVTSTRNPKRGSLNLKVALRVKRLGQAIRGAVW